MKKSCLAGLNKVPEVITCYLTWFLVPRSENSTKEDQHQGRRGNYCIMKDRGNLGNLILSKTFFLPTKTSCDFYLPNQIANCCWWPIRKATPTSQTLSCFNSHVWANCPVKSTDNSDSRCTVSIAQLWNQERTIRETVAACCTMRCPVIKRVLTLVSLRKATSRILTPETDQRAVVAVPTKSGNSAAILLFAAASPK